MTVIEIFPLVTAIAVVVFSASLLAQKAGLPNWLAWLIALFLGACVRMSFWMVARLVPRFCRSDDHREKRVYQELELNGNFPAAKNLYYECRNCGNALPSMSKRDTVCKCRNIKIGKQPGHIE